MPNNNNPTHPNHQTEHDNQTDNHADNHELLTIAEAAAVLRTPVATLRYWRHLGTGPHSFRLGRRILYRTHDLHTWINHQHDNNGPNAA